MAENAEDRNQAARKAWFMMYSPSSGGKVELLLMEFLLKPGVGTVV